MPYETEQYAGRRSYGNNGRSPYQPAQPVTATSTARYPPPPGPQYRPPQHRGAYSPNAYQPNGPHHQPGYQPPVSQSQGRAPQRSMGGSQRGYGSASYGNTQAARTAAGQGLPPQAQTAMKQAPPSVPGGPTGYSASNLPNIRTDALDPN